MLSTVGTVTKHPLVVLLVHGVGRSDIPAEEQFEQRIKAATKRRLPRAQQHLADRLQFCTPNWGTQFDGERSGWLAGLFPESARGGSTQPLIRNLLRLGAWAIAAMLIVTILHALIFGRDPGVVWDIVVVVAVPLLFLQGARWIFPGPMAGWGAGLLLESGEGSWNLSILVSVKNT